jgi:mannose-6-phosphate isomerase-like protein (cupin superfamily)
VKNFHIVEHEIAASLLLESLYQRPDLWARGLRETYQGSAHRDAKSIILRWCPIAEGEDPAAVSFDRCEAKDTRAFAELAPMVWRPFLQLVKKLEGPIGAPGRSLIALLPPGGKITPHIDEGLYADYFDRFHIVLQGTCLFRCGAETHRPQPGEAFWFNHKLEHSVENDGDIDRIHLIIDYMAPAYRARRGTYFQEERVSALWDESMPLLERHFDEIAHYKDIALAPDQVTYEEMERAGVLRCYTARHNGELVGYAVFFVRPGMHYRHSLQAIQDVLFVVPERRVGTTGIRLIRFAEARLKALGVQVVYHHAKLTNRVGELLVKLGYELVDQLYAKRLD